MTEERIALIEKYLGSVNSRGLLIQTWHELRSALSNLHASLTLCHCTPDQVAERERILELRSKAFADILAEMHEDLAAENPDISTRLPDDFMAQANEPGLFAPVDPTPCYIDVGGEG